MAEAFVFVGEQPMDYPTLGLTVKPGDVAYFEHRAPDKRWQPAPKPQGGGGENSEQSEDEPPTGGEGEQGDGDGPKRPNKAASAEDWKAYALAMQVPAEIVEASTRQAIIDHFTGVKPLDGVAPVEPPKE